MKLNEGFKNVFTYAAGMRAWVDKALPLGPLEYSFVSDFAIADWVSGEKGVKETYERVKKEWLKNYKAFTEVVLAVNQLAWAHDRLEKQGFEGRQPFVELYSSLYHQAVNDFYTEYEGDSEKCRYFFEMTD